MKIKIHYIPAFTIVEMLVALAVSTIVIGTAYMILLFITTNIGKIQNNYTENTTTDLFSQQLHVDFNRYGEIFFLKSEQSLLLRTPLDSVQYIFEENVVLRNRDTVWKDNYKLEFFLSGIVVDNGVVDGIKFMMRNDEDGSYIFQSRRLDSNQKMMVNGN